MKVLRGVIVLVVLSIASFVGSSAARADTSSSTPAQACPAFGGWVLYRIPVGGSGGIAGVYFANRGDCVSFFALNPDYEFLASVHPNPQP